MADRKINSKEAVAAHTRDALKWVFQVAMGGSLTLASTKTFEALLYLLNAAQAHLSLTQGATLLAIRPSQEVLLRYPSPPAAMMSIALFLLVFLPVFLRFYYGDVRYIDLHYDELRWSAPLEVIHPH